MTREDAILLGNLLVGAGAVLVVGGSIYCWWKQRKAGNADAERGTWNPAWLVPYIFMLWFGWGDGFGLGILAFPILSFAVFVFGIAALVVLSVRWRDYAPRRAWLGLAAIGGVVVAQGAYGVVVAVSGFEPGLGMLVALRFVQMLACCGLGVYLYRGLQGINDKDAGKPRAAAISAGEER